MVSLSATEKLIFEIVGFTRYIGILVALRILAVDHVDVRAGVAVVGQRACAHAAYSCTSKLKFRQGVVTQAPL